MGKVILAFQPPEFVSVVVHKGLQSFTPHTITEASAYPASLRSYVTGALPLIEANTAQEASRLQSRS